MSIMKSTYLPLKLDQEDLEFIDTSVGISPEKTRIQSCWFWRATTLVASLAFCLLFIKDHVLPNRFGTFDRGFKTELSTATPNIELTTVKFTGNIRFGKPGDPTARGSYLPHTPGTKQFVGSPSDEIDANWEEIIADRYFWVSDAEAASMWPDELDTLYHREGKGYVAGLDVLHTLHCVDMMRKMLDPEYYPDAAKMMKTGRAHNLHCIDHLRQYLMCTGDFTPVPTKWIDSTKQLYVDSDRPHTCRNFQNVLDWVSTREIVYRIDEP